MFYWINSVILTLLFFWAGNCYSRYNDQRVTDNAPHLSMTTAELRRYFGATSVDEVPEYEITHPVPSNENGDIISDVLPHVHTRLRRNTDQPNVIYYRLKAFGIDLHLNVTLNTNLLAPNFMIETLHMNGSKTVTKPPATNHLIGKVVSHNESIVAISSEEGQMTGMIQLPSESYFVQPLPRRLAQRHKRSVSSVPHVVVKKSVQGEDSQCNHEAEMTYRAVDRRRRRLAVDSDAVESFFTEILHKYLQTVYVVDRYATEFYGLSTLEIILPTLANIVAGIYRDESFGEIKINYILNKIVIANNTEFSYESGASTAEKMEYIKTWTRKNNPQSEEDPNHFDTATLISSGDAGGRGVLGTICTDSHATSNVVNLAGLSSSGTIAHEVFHNIGYEHDLTTECPNGKYIMATTVSSGSAGFTWSKCSRDFAQWFLSSEASSCLNDPPSSPIERPTKPSILKSKLPGEIYDADKQCELQYGSLYKACPTTQNQCDSVYCTSDDKSCATNFAPPLDGTRCGVRHWCIKGVCVDDGSPMIDGGWGNWSEYGSCTKWCGIGVQFQTRKCDNPSPQNGGRDCEGSVYGNYKTCNTQACAANVVSFRQLQCSEKGDYKENIRQSDPCSLVCQSGSYLYWLGTVKDGTRCYDDKNTLDICVEGHCKEVGCDYELQSGKRLDRCGVCGGDGNSCGLNIVSYTKASFKYEDYGYKKATTMVTLPKHSTNVVAINKAATYNNIGVQSVDGEYLINLPSWSTTVEAAGTTISYSHEDNRYQDRVYILGPTYQEIKLVYVYLYEHQNAAVDISYYAPGDGNLPQATENVWKVSSWSDCSRSCAAGMKTRLLTCVREDDQTEIGFKYCNESTRPAVVESCNTQACPPEWYASSWQTCSLSCGKGSQQRSVICRQKLCENKWKTLANDSFCPEPKPVLSPLVRNCNEINCPPEYVGLEWSECSTTCSPGVLTRQLECRRRTEHGTIEVLPDLWCQKYGSVKLPSTEICNADVPCEPPSQVEIGCFQLDSSIFSLVLANYQDTLDFDNVLATVRSCAKLTYHQNYMYFGLANDGECRVGPKLESSFFKPLTSEKCVSSVGQKDAIFVFTLGNLPELSPVGCFREEYYNRAMPILYKNFRNQIDWYRMNKTVHQCAQVAYHSGYKYFGVQFYGECWSGKDAGSTYNKYGKVNECWMGVGTDFTNFVYKFN